MGRAKQAKPKKAKSKRGERGASSPTSPTRLRAAERQEQAIKLRRQGLSLAEVARRVGYKTHVGARKAILAGLHRRIAADADAVRAMELERCDALHRKAWEDLHAAGDGPQPDDYDDPKVYVAARSQWDRERMNAFDRIHRIQNFRAKLVGAHAPDRKEVSGPKGGPVQLSNLDVTQMTDEQLRRLAAGGDAG